MILTGLFVAIGHGCAMTDQRGVRDARQDGQHRQQKRFSSSRQIEFHPDASTLPLQKPQKLQKALCRARLGNEGEAIAASAIVPICPHLAVSMPF